MQQGMNACDGVGGVSSGRCVWSAAAFEGDIIGDTIQCQEKKEVMPPISPAVVHFSPSWFTKSDATGILNSHEPFLCLFSLGCVKEVCKRLKLYLT